MPFLHAFLRGSWSVERTLSDLGTGQCGTFEGRVVFREDRSAELAGGLRQVESGTVDWAGHRGPAFREYLWRPSVTASALDSFFPDGRFFHSLDLSTGRWEAEHGCGEDLYRVSYVVVSDDELRYRWLVEGPAKTLELDTVLRRTDPDPA